MLSQHADKTRAKNCDQSYGFKSSIFRRFFLLLKDSSTQWELPWWDDFGAFLESKIWRLQIEAYSLKASNGI